MANEELALFWDVFETKYFYPSLRLSESGLFDNFGEVLLHNPHIWVEDRVKKVFSHENYIALLRLIQTDGAIDE